MTQYKPSMVSVAMAALGAIAASPAGCAAAANPSTALSPMVTTYDGKLQGGGDGEVEWFKGIPFAAPPIGKLRWRAPQAVQRWTGVRPAKSFSSDCAAIPDTNPWISTAAPQSEDCLYLNIWKPSKARSPLPVMVWIYGGGFTNGGTGVPIYDGSNLARKGVILVSINYRLGQLGFFAHPALAKEQAGEPRGNYGFLDQIAAMKWVRRNISAFGGDPKNVTVFGESAGGFSVHMLLTSPLAKGLVDKAIIQSGGGRRTIMYGQRMSDNGTGKRPSAELTGLAWAKSHGIEGTGPEALEKLRELPVADVLKGMGFINPLYSGPMIDGTIVPYNMMTAYNTGRFAHVPLIIGSTTGDMSLNRATSKDAFFATYGPDAPTARDVYDPTGDADLKTVLSEAGADQMMHEPARFTARHFSKANAPTYLYRFGYIASLNAKGRLATGTDAKVAALRDTFSYGGTTGAFHTTEIPFVFDTLYNRFGHEVSSQDREVADMMSGYWVSFARTGNPNGGGRPEWAPYKPTSDALLIVGETKTGMTPDPWGNRLDVTETFNKKIEE